MVDGAIAMIDILGWKGIWQRREPQGALDALGRIESGVQRVFDVLEKNTTIVGHQKFSGIARRVFTISDTIVLHAQGEPEKAMELVGGCCATVVSHALVEGLFVRGALGYGQYLERGWSFVGPIVDEVASWYEQTNIIGVCVTPQGRRIVDRLQSDVKVRFPLTKVSVKGQGVMDMACVNWPQTMGEYLKKDEILSLYDQASNGLVISPDIESKLAWGKQFIEAHTTHN